MLTLLKPADYRRQRWKNGGGVTDEIAADAESSPPAWRISVATIESDGPFSDFRGYDRTILALDGGPVRLAVDGIEVDLAPHEPFDFRGESSVNAKLLDAAARDFNVMTRRDEFAHDVDIVSSPEVFVVDDDELVFVYIVEGRAAINGQTCAAGQTAYLDSIERVELRPEADAILCVTRITPR